MGEVKNKRDRTGVSSRIRCDDAREILGCLPNLLSRRPVDVIERAPGVKIFHRGWQVGQTTQK